jgi:thiol-disulfide isomerase/thioredoxin
MARSGLEITIVLLAILISAFFSNGCVSGDDDDDDDSGASGGFFCENLASCGYGSDLNIGSLDQCDSYFASLSSIAADCALASSNCDQLAACLNLDVDGDDDIDDDINDDADDDVDDDADDDDDDDDDDDVAPELKSSDSSFELSAADPELELWMEWNGSNFNPVWELAAYWVGWSDRDDDLGGGNQFVSLDGADPIVRALSPGIARSGSWDDRDIGLELSGDFALPGHHTIQIWIEDEEGRESNIITKGYDVGGTNFSIGQPFTDFTLRGFKKDVGFSDYTLSDSLGKVIVIDSFAGWCPPCDDEAPELDTLKETYGDVVLEIFSLMQEDAWGSAPNDDALENWTLYHYGNVGDGDRTEQLTGIVLNDAGAAVAGPFYPANYVPSNFILDQDHILRMKISGWYSPWAVSAIDYLLGLN